MKELQHFHNDKSVTSPQHFIEYCTGSPRQAHAWIALRGKSPIGFAVSRDWFNFVRAKKARTVDLLYIKESYRRQGIGKRILITVAKNAVGKDIERIDISSSKKNRIAHQFYQQHGFEQSLSYGRNYKIEGTALSRLVKQK